MIDVNAIGKTIVDKVQSSHGISDERTCGKIIYSGDGIIHISGLSDVKYNELLEVQGGYKALALNLERDSPASDAGLDKGTGSKCRRDP